MDKTQINKQTLILRILTSDMKNLSFLIADNKENKGGEIERDYCY